jgi:hypothetical protein
MLLKPGDIIVATLCYCKEFREASTIYVNRGDVFKVGDFCFLFDENINLSRPSSRNAMQPLDKDKDSPKSNDLRAKLLKTESNKIIQSEIKVKFDRENDRRRSSGSLSSGSFTPKSSTSSSSIRSSHSVEPTSPTISMNTKPRKAYQDENSSVKVIKVDRDNVFKRLQDDKLRLLKSNEKSLSVEPTTPTTTVYAKPRKAYQDENSSVRLINDEREKVFRRLEEDKLRRAFHGDEKSSSSSSSSSSKHSSKFIDLKRKFQHTYKKSC